MCTSELEAKNLGWSANSKCLQASPNFILQFTIGLQFIFMIRTLTFDLTKKYLC